MMRDEAPAGPWLPGETRSIGHLTVTRTDRDYVYDLRDAYNDAMSVDARRRGLEWYVTPGGELKLDFTGDAMRRNAKRIEQRRTTEQARSLQRSFEDAA